MPRSLYKKVGIAAVIMMASVFLSRFFGFFRLMVIAYVGGRSGEVDAYQVAFFIPEILNHMVPAAFFPSPSFRFFPVIWQKTRKPKGGEFFLSL